MKKLLFILLPLFFAFALCGKDHAVECSQPETLTQNQLQDSVKMDTVLIEVLLTECQGCRASSEIVYGVFETKEKNVNVLTYLDAKKKPLPKNVKVWMISKLNNG